MSLIPLIGGPSWTTAIGAVLLSGATLGVVGFVKGCDYEKGKATAALLKATQEARETETNWNIAVQAQEELHAEEIARINAARLAAERRLLNRPSRLSAPAAPASQSATGANLFREDGQFLRGESARADELRAALDRCQVWIDKVSK